MTVMVTGTGFVGGYVVRDLVESGEDVILYGFFGGRGESASTELPDLQFLDQLLGGDLFDKVQVVVGDVTDETALSDAIATHGVSSIIHLASMVGAASEANPPAAVRVNAGGTVNVFEAAVRHELDRVVWASSITVFGPRSVDADGVIGDGAPFDPASVYGAAKVFTESLAERYFENHGLDSTGLRLSRVYGFGDHIKATRGSGTSWLVDAFYNAATGAQPATFLFGERMFDFHYVEDVSTAFVRALRGPAGNGRSFLTHGDYRPLREAFDYLAEMLPDSDLRLVEGSGDLPPGSSLAWARRYDAGRAERELGIRSRYSMEEGLYRMVRAYRRHASLPDVVRPQRKT